MFFVCLVVVVCGFICLFFLRGWVREKRTSGETRELNKFQLGAPLLLFLGALPYSPPLLVKTLSIITVKEFPQAGIAWKRGLLNPAFYPKPCNLRKGPWPRHWHTRRLNRSALLVSYFMSRACLETYGFPELFPGCSPPPASL